MRRVFLATFFAAGVLLPQLARGADITLQNGFQIRGRVAETVSVSHSPLGTSATEVKLKEIYVIDDDLRRIFVPAKQVVNHVPGDFREERIKIDFHRVAAGNRRVASIGSILRVTPFNEFGRRVFTMSSPQGSLDIVQGITLVTPTFIKVEGLQSQNPYVMDMRIATSAVPREVLSEVLLRQIDLKDVDARLKIVRLYTDAERFRDARIELERVIEDFPDLEALKAQIRRLNQLRANRLVQEIVYRKDAGQHQRAYTLLDAYPSKGVAAETLLKVRDLLGEYQTQVKQREQVLELIKEHLAALASDATRAQVSPVCNEIMAELNVHTLPRMASYLRLADDPTLTVEQKLALGISGWLMGADAATENMAIASSLARARPLVFEYLRSKRSHEREDSLAKMMTMEGLGPANLAKLLAHLKPPGDLQDARQLGDGLFEVTTSGPPGEPDITYLVQLPPEYTPHRHYPCVLTLHGGGSSAEMQVDWWAGGYSKERQQRLGQATRHGYIVIAPRWTKEHQRHYEFSFREHAVVLTSLRDACQRLSIDTDRVFLSGHSMGGDAAWDIGLAHPDLWAGLIPIVATAGKYIHRYGENGRGLPMYFVGGDMDGNRMAEFNAREFDDYLTYVGYDVVVVEYRGRGHEHFQDEVQHIFDWMGLQTRNFAPRKIKVNTMRPWDNFFWFLELEDFPERTQVAPMAWPRPSARPAITEAEVLPNNNISIGRAGGSKVTVYLSPDLVRFEQPFQVSLKGRRLPQATPSIAVMLEDVRTRGDRLHPFWAKTQNH